MWVFWVLFAVAAIGLVLVMVRVERRRSGAQRAAHQAAAARLGAAYVSEAPPALVDKISGFDLTFSDGASLARFVRNVFTRSGPGGEVHVFLHEHRGTLPAGTGAAGAMTHRETVGCVISPALRLPRFRLSPERPLEKLVSLLGLRDIDFDSHPGFSESYYLHAGDEAAGRRLFGTAVLDFFQNRPGWHVEGRGDTLLVYRFAKTASLEELPAFFTQVDEISALFAESFR